MNIKKLNEDVEQTLEPTFTIPFCGKDIKFVVITDEHGAHCEFAEDETYSYLKQECKNFKKQFRENATKYLDTDHLYVVDINLTIPQRAY